MYTHAHTHLPCTKVKLRASRRILFQSLELRSHKDGAWGYINTNLTPFRVPKPQNPKTSNPKPHPLVESFAWNSQGKL